MKIGRFGFAGSLMLGVGVSLMSPQAHATDYYVSNLTPDWNLNDGACGLSEAIASAGGPTSFGGCPTGETSNTITITGDPSKTISLTTSYVIPIFTTVVLTANEGPNYFQKIIGNQEQFKVTNGGYLSVENLSFQGFKVTPFSVQSKSTLSLDLVDISNNRGPDVGFQSVGIWNSGGTVYVYDSSIHDNTGGIKGGAVLNEKGGYAEIVYSSLYNNKVSQYGGAICNSGSGSHVFIKDSTLSGNGAGCAQGGLTGPCVGGGGGLYNASGASADVISTTITANHGTTSTNRPSSGAGIYTSSGSTVRIRGSIVADNIADELGGNPVDCVGALTSQGWNLLQRCYNTVPGYEDFVSTSANLGPLTHPTYPEPFWHPPYHKPNAGSPVINYIVPGGTQECAQYQQDQIQNPRLSHGYCDIGAIELQ